MAGTNFNIGVNDNEVVSRLQKVIDSILQMGNVAKSTGADMKNSLGSLKDTESIKKAYNAIGAAMEQNDAELQKLIGRYHELRQYLKENQQGMSGSDRGAIRAEINQLNHLIGVRKALNQELQNTSEKVDSEAIKVEAAGQKQKAFRTELRETTEEYNRMKQAIANGENVDLQKFDQLEQKLAQLRKTTWETGQTMRKLSTPGTGLQGVVQGVGALTGAFSAAQGVMGLFNSKSEDMQKIMLRVQSLMTIMMGLQQIQNALLKTSALQIGVVGKVQQWWTGVMVKATAAQAAQNVAIKAGSVGVKGLGGAFRVLGVAIKSIPGIGWLIAGITAVIALISKVTKKTREARKEQEEYNKTVREMATDSIASFERLRVAYNRLGDDMEAKRKFIRDNADEFRNLKLAIDSTEAADNAFINRSNKVVEALILRAKAGAKEEQIKKAVKDAVEAEQALEQFQKAHPNVQRVIDYDYEDLPGSGGMWVENPETGEEYRVKTTSVIVEGARHDSEASEMLVNALDELEKNKKDTRDTVEKLVNESIELSDQEKEILGKLSLEEKDKSAGKTGGTKEDPTEKAVKRVQEQLTVMQNLREFYKQYAELTEDKDSALEKTREIFGDITELPEGMDMAAAATGDYVKVLEAFKKQLEAIGGDKAKEAVATIDETIRAFKEGQALDAAKAKQNLDKIFEEWNNHDFSADKDNAFFGGVGKVLAEMGQGLDELANKVNAQVETLMAARSTMTEKEYNDAYEKLQLFYQKEREKIKENAKYRLSQLGDTISDDILKKFSKTFEQASKVGIKAMKKELEAMKSVAGKDFGFFSEDDKTLLKGLLGMSENDDLWANLGDVAEETLEKVLKTDNLQPEQKALIQALHGLAKEGESLQPILDAIKDKLGTGVAQGQATVNGVSAESVQQYAAWAGRLGQAIGGRTGAGIGALAGAAGNLASNWSKLGQEGGEAAAAAMIVEGAIQFYDMFASQAKANKQVMRDWEAACKEAAQATRIYAIEQLRYKPSNVWGIESPFKKLEDSGKMYDEAFKQLQDVSRQIAESGKLAKGVKKQVSDVNVMKGVGAGALVGAGVGSFFGPIGTAIGAAAGAIVGGIVGLFSKKKVKKYKNLTDVYGDIYDPETFELNQEILNDYAKMDDATKQLIDNWDEIKEKMKEAEEEMENTIADLTGDINGMLYDSLIKAFDNDDLYGAMQDIENYFSEMLKRMAVQSLIAGIWEDAAKKLQEGAKQSFFAGGDGSLIDDIMDFFDYTKEVFPVAVDAMAGIKDGLEKAGLKWDTNGATSGSTGGYTTQMSHEDASEINGRMTDIQMQIRLIQGNIVQIVSLQQETRGFARMQADYLYDIRRYTATLPTIAEYSKKIATNTANL